MNEKFSEIVYHIASGDDETGLRIADDVDREESEQSEANPGAVMGRSRGVFSMVVNGITSGKFFCLSGGWPEVYYWVRQYGCYDFDCYGSAFVVPGPDICNQCVSGYYEADVFGGQAV